MIKNEVAITTNWLSLSDYICGVYALQKRVTEIASFRFKFIWKSCRSSKPYNRTNYTPSYPLKVRTDQVISEGLDYWSSLARLDWRNIFCNEHCLLRLY